MPEAVSSPDPVERPVSPTPVDELRSPPIVRPLDVVIEPIGSGLEDWTSVSDMADSPNLVVDTASLPLVGEFRPPPIVCPSDVIIEPIGWGLEEGTPAPDMIESSDPVENPDSLPPTGEFRFVEPSFFVVPDCGEPGGLEELKVVSESPLSDVDRSPGDISPGCR